MAPLVSRVDATLFSGMGMINVLTKVHYYICEDWFFLSEPVITSTSTSRDTLKESRMTVCS